MALDEGGGVGAPHQLHAASPGPAHGHDEDPDALLVAILVQVGQAAPVHLSLLPGSRLEAHGGLRLSAMPPGRHVGLQDGIAAVIAQGPQLPQSATQFSRPSSRRRSTYSV